jgi:hypothetical protein
MTPRRLDVAANEWRAADISAVCEVLSDVGADPELAREWRGSVDLTFAEVPEDYPYLTPSIVTCLKKLYAEVPHLLYFLNPDQASGTLDGFCASNDALHQDEHGVWFMWSDDVAAAFYRALAAAAEFAIEQGDDWAAVVDGYAYDESQSRASEIREMLIARGVIPT